MSRGKRSYSAEFKAEAINIADEIGVSKAANKVGISYQTLKNWIDIKAKIPGKDGRPSYTDLERENKRLKRELGYMDKINDVLKKSTAILSKDLMDDID